MNNFSRKLVIIIVVIITQSSLGTKAIQIINDNLGQNGYVKYSNGLLMQWGYSSSSGRNKTIYLPTSFYDTNYSVLVTMKRTVDDTTNYTGDVWTQNKSSFLSPYFLKYLLISLSNSAIFIGFDKYSSKPSFKYISFIPVIALAVNATIGGIL